MSSFLPFVITSFGAACTFTIVVLRLGRPRRGFPGLIGAWAATAVLAAVWQAEAIPWLWEFIRALLFVWLGALALLITAVVLIWPVKEPGRRLLLCCAMVSLVVNVVALGLFLWAATVSPGGV
jgi:hypothetical protein